MYCCFWELCGEFWESASSIVKCVLAMAIKYFFFPHHIPWGLGLVCIKTFSQSFVYLKVLWHKNQNSWLASTSTTEGPLYCNREILLVNACWHLHDWGKGLDGFSRFDEDVNNNKLISTGPYRHSQEAVQRTSKSVMTKTP